MTHRIPAVLCAALLAVTSAPAGSAAIGTFTRNLRGVSTFVEEGSNIHLRGAYSGLPKATSYFSVLYGGTNVQGQPNTNCDPVGAFPVGPFYSKRGRAAANVVMGNPNGVDAATTLSISVRRGDDQSDIDGDGKLGPTDVVAVPGKPSVGLLECDSSPFTN